MQKIDGFLMELVHTCKCNFTLHPTSGLGKLWETTQFYAYCLLFLYLTSNAFDFANKTVVYCAQTWFLLSVLYKY